MLKLPFEIELNFFSFLNLFSCPESDDDNDEDVYENDLAGWLESSHIDSIQLYSSSSSSSSSYDDDSEHTSCLLNGFYKKDNIW